MGVDSWTRSPHERKLRERAKKYERDKNRHEPLTDRATEYVRNRWRGEHHKCACGCGKAGDMFRGGQRYNARCVGSSSKWDKAGLPEDRTPPMSKRRKRDLTDKSRWLERDGEA